MYTPYAVKIYFSYLDGFVCLLNVGIMLLHCSRFIYGINIFMFIRIFSCFHMIPLRVTGIVFML